MPVAKGNLSSAGYMPSWTARNRSAALWISSLTDEAIRKGLEELKDGSEYDSLYAAADSRAKADWLVGMNASRALAIVSGSSNNSIGRVQTPTLAMICSRYKENRSFVSTPYWQLHVTLNGGTSHRRFFHPATFDDRQKAEAAYRSLSPDSSATVTKVERRKTLQQPPLLYDLTALQKDCNVHLDLPAAKTLDIAQSLYEKKLISYPRTGSRYIPHDVMACVPGLLERIMAMPGFATSAGILDFARLNTRSVDDRKVTDHHALITTGIAPEGLSEAEEAVYTLIAGRMLEAFSPYCEKEMLLMECRLEGMDFRSKGSTVVSPGWRGILAGKRTGRMTSRKPTRVRPYLPKGTRFRFQDSDWPRRRPCPDRSIPKPRCWRPWRPAAGR